MIHEIDAALQTLLDREALQGTDVQVVFDAPTTEWASRRGGPTVNAYLYDIREDTSRRSVAYEEIRDEAGVVVGRQAPPRWFKLSYLVTAWTQRPEDEHRLLSLCLGALLKYDTLPRDLMTGSLANASHLLTSVALPAGQDRSAVELWSALGGELKPSLDLRVTAPFVSGQEGQVGPPISEPFGMRVVGPDGRPESRQDAMRKRREAAAALTGASVPPTSPEEYVYGRPQDRVAAAARARSVSAAVARGDTAGAEAASRTGTAGGGAAAAGAPAAGAGTGSGSRRGAGRREVLVGGTGAGDDAVLGTEPGRWFRIRAKADPRSSPPKAGD